MTPLLIDLGLAAIGVVAIVAGVITYRNAERITQDARRVLTEMFESVIPQVFAEPTSPRGAQGAGIGFVILGVALVVTAAVAAVLGVSWR